MNVATVLNGAAPYVPIARIAIRYAVGTLVGSDVADIMAGDPDVVTVVAAAVGVVVEGLYATARKRGWAT